MQAKCAEELDFQSIQEFIDDFLEIQETIEQQLVTLESAPNNREIRTLMQEALGDIIEKTELLRLDHAYLFAFSLLEVVTAFAEERIPFSPRLSEVIMLAMDRLRTICQSYVDTNPLDEAQNHKIQQQLVAMPDLEPTELYSAIQYTLGLLSSSFETLDEDFDFSFGAESDVDSEVSTAMERDLDLFFNLMNQMEQRSIFWQGRGERALSLAMEMNAAANSPVSPYQLTAAVYLHDVGMGFLPEFLISKASELDSHEYAKMRQHPIIASQIADRMEGWEEARDMVLQHHEHENGQGYPQGLKGDEIGEGAKLLAIVDAFVALTRPRADRKHKRSVVTAVMEINKYKGEQFSAHWVTVFNTVIRHRYLEQH